MVSEGTSEKPWKGDTYRLQYAYICEMELIPKPELQKYFNKKAYLNKVLQQIQRDFDMAACPLEFQKNEIEDLDELQEILIYNLTPLMKENSTRIKNLLYRVDVSEKAIYNQMAANPDLQLIDLLNSSIIERELMKVLTREKFSSR